MSGAAFYILLAVVGLLCFLGQVSSRSTGSNHAPTCEEGEFHCPGTLMCIPGFWVCDRDEDCEGGEDEATCEHRAACGPDEFMCGSQDECIPFPWRCDGDGDCGDDSDELSCDTQQDEQEERTHQGHGSHGNRHQGHRHFRHTRPRHLN